MNASQPPPGQPPQQGAQPKQGGPPGSGPSADATAHVADLERQIRQRTWIAAIGIIIALAGTAVAIYLAIDARDNGASKEDSINLPQELGIDGDSESATEQGVDQAEQSLEQEAAVDEASGELTPSEAIELALATSGGGGGGGQGSGRSGDGGNGSSGGGGGGQDAEEALALEKADRAAARKRAVYLLRAAAVATALEALGRETEKVRTKAELKRAEAKLRQQLARLQVAAGNVGAKLDREARQLNRSVERIVRRIEREIAAGEEEIVNELGRELADFGRSTADKLNRAVEAVERGDVEKARSLLAEVEQDLKDLERLFR